MNVAYLLFGHPWLYDNAVKHYGHNNTYKYKYNKKTILLRLVKLVTRTCPLAKSSDKIFPSHRF